MFLCILTIALLTPQCFQIPLTPRMFPVWVFVVGIFDRKAMLNMGWLLLNSYLVTIAATTQTTEQATAALVRVQATAAFNGWQMT